MIVDAATNELKRIMRLNLKAGNAMIVERHTANDKTGTLLRDPAMATPSRFPRTSEMAKEYGIGKVYEIIYGMLSLRSHAAAFAAPERDGMDEELAGYLHAGASIIRCLHLVLNNRIREMRVTTGEKVALLLKVEL